MQDNQAEVLAQIETIDLDIARRKKQIKQQEEKLSIIASAITQSINNKSQDGKIEILSSSLKAWLRQAQLLKRSDEHLTKIEQLIDENKYSTRIYTKIAIRDFAAMQYDNTAFTELALEIIPKHLAFIEE